MDSQTASYILGGCAHPQGYLKSQERKIKVEKSRGEEKESKRAVRERTIEETVDSATILQQIYPEGLPPGSALPMRRAARFTTSPMTWTG